MRYGDGSVLGVASRGEGVGRLGGDDVNFGHGDTDALRHALNDGVGAGKLLASDGLGAVHLEGQLVGIEIAEEVHSGGKDEGDDHALLAAEVSAGKDEEHGEGGEQKGGLKRVHRRASCAAVVSIGRSRRLGDADSDHWRGRSVLFSTAISTANRGGSAEAVEAVYFALL